MLSNLISKYLLYSIRNWKDDNNNVIPSLNPSWPHGNLHGFNPKENIIDRNIYIIWDSIYPIVVLADPCDIKNFYKYQSLHTRRSDACMGNTISKLMSNCIGVQYGSYHNKMVKLLKNYFTPNIIDLRMHDIHKIIISWVNKQCLNGIIDSSSIFDEIPFLIVSNYVYGELNNNDIVKLKEFCKRFHNIVATGTSIRRKRTEWIFNFYPFDKHNINISNFLNDWYSWNKEIANLNQDSIVSKLLSNNDCSEEFIFDTLSEIIFTNIEITAATCGWLTYNLAKNVEFQDELRESMQYNNKEDNYSLYKNLKNNNILTSAIRESARLNPGVILTIPEIIHDDIILGGYNIPKGTLISIDVERFNSNPDIWIDSKKYNPYRFINNKISPTKFHMFGVGNRRCIGQYLATSILRLLIYELLRNHKLSILTNETPYIPSIDVGLPFFVSPAKYPNIYINNDQE